MDWYYAQNNERRGPVKGAALEALVRSGEIQPTALVWREGMSNWQPYSTTSLSALPEAGHIACTECGKVFPETDILRIKNSIVCAACKPEFLAKVARGDPTGKSAVWRWRKELVISCDAALPDRCVKCNTSEGVTRVKRKLYWHHPAIYLLLLLPFRVILYLIVALMVRKKATVYAGLCARHRRRRITIILICWAFMLISVAGIVYGIATSSGNAAIWITAVVLLLGAIFAAAFGARVIYPTKIDAQYTRVRGVCKEYLAELPEWNGV